MAFFSRRGRVVGTQLFVLPFCLAVLWVLIPLTSYVLFCLSVFVYYSITLFVWLTYYDIVIPGCPKAFILASYLIFSGLSFCAFWFIRNTFHDENEKFAFLFLGAFQFACSSGCYLVWVAYYYFQYRIDPSILHQAPQTPGYGTVSTLRPVEHSRWSEGFVKAFSSTSTIDNDDADSSSEEEDPTKNQVIEEDGMRRMTRSLLPHQECQDFQEQIEKDMSKREREWDYPRIGFRSFFFSICFQLALLGVWLWLQVFTSMIGDGENFSSDGSIFGAIVLFELSRVVCLMVCLYLNHMLPPAQETRYFTQFLLRLTFWFYYRSIFVNFTGWFPTIGASILVFISRLILYPLMMTQRSYRFIYSTLRKILTTDKSLAQFSFLAFMFDPTITPYENHVTDLVVEYYYDMIGAIFSLATTIVVIAVIKGSDYNLKYYKLYDDNLDGDDFAHLMFRYVYLFGFELLTDRIIRFICQYFMGINIGDQGRKLTVDHVYTRYLFAVFVLYASVDIYYSLMSPTGF